MASEAEPFEERVAAVHEALNRGDIPGARALVMHDDWPAGLKADSTGDGADATYRVACALVLSDWDAYRGVRKRFTKICDPTSERLKKLLEVADRWWVLRRLDEFPQPLIDFAILVPISFRERQLEVARELAAWYWADPAAAIALFRRIDKSSVDIVPFIVDIARSFEGDLSKSATTLPLTERKTPTRVLLPLLVPVVALAAASVVAAALLLPDRAAPTLGQQARDLLAAPIAILFVGTGLFILLHGLQARYLQACLGADVEPGSDPALSWMNPLLQDIARRNGTLRLGYWVGRLGRL